MRYTIHCLTGIICLVAAAIPGCFATPKVESDPRIDRPGEIEKTVYADYWMRRDVPFIRDKRGLKVAIIEFSVEFVTVKMLKGIPGGAAKIDITAVTPIGAGLSLLGIGKRVAEYEPDLLEQLPGQLYKSFVSVLTREGVQVYPTRFVVDSDAYKKFLTVDKDESSFFQRFNIVGSDTGRIRASVTYPMEGLGVIAGAEGGDVIDVDAELMKELGADYVIRARFRVGVHEGAASIERGSVVTVTEKDVLGSLESGRSIFSDQSVLRNEGFLPIRGNKYEVHTRKYELAMKSLFPRYVRIALRAR